ncbi:MAG: peptide deformylase [Fimbriimonadaceae bacterium]
MNVVVPEEYRYLYEADYAAPILVIPNAKLRETATPVKKVTKNVQQLMSSMVQIMRKANGVGLAAPQLGILQRVIVMEPEEDRVLALANPVITHREGVQISEEGCLSIPGLYGDVQRAASVILVGLDRKGREIEVELEGRPAVIAQHELDHLDGKLFIDLVDPTTLRWQHPLTRDESTV